MSALFSIIIVSLNPGERLRKTLLSIKAQSFTDYEVILKDGGSSDGSVEPDGYFEGVELKLIIKKDKGIYDAMNEAASCATGSYVYFLNCGDVFADKDVLKRVAAVISGGRDTAGCADIIYGNIFDMKTNRMVSSNPKMDAFGCYRNVPCHQACFYKRELVAEHLFELKYKVRADYEHFLWCFFVKKAHTQYIDTVIAEYEGGGYSAKNKTLSDAEHKEITARYMSGSELLKYRLILLLTLAPLRTALSESPVTAGIYNAVKRFIYRAKK